MANPLPKEVLDAIVDICLMQILDIVKDQEKYNAYRYLYEFLGKNDELFLDRVKAVYRDQIDSLAKNS